MQSQATDLSCMTPTSEVAEETTYTSIEQALFAAVELANDNEPCCPTCGTDMCGSADDDARMARGTEQIAVAKPDYELLEIIRPDIDLPAEPEASEGRLSFAVGALLMAAGAHMLLISLNLQQ